MTRPRRWLERPVRFALDKSAAHFSAEHRKEIADTAWRACTDAGARGGPGAFAAAAAGEIAALLSSRLARLAGAGPRVTASTSSASPSGGISMTFIDDLARAAQRLRSHPATPALSVAMLALAIGVTTAMFTVLDALMLHPVPFRDPDRLTSVVISTGSRYLSTVPPAVLSAWQTSGAFESVGGAMQARVELDTGDELVARAGALVTPGLLETVGVRPILGRIFAAGEGRAGTDDRIILSEDVWSALFHRDPGLIGRRIRVSGVSTEVIGILPAGFRFPRSRTVAWRPIDFGAPPAGVQRGEATAIARLKADLPAADALALADRALRAARPTETDEHAAFRPLASGMVDKYSKRSVTALSIGVLLVFLVLCANAMNLMLTRFSSRHREFGVCSALGASRARLLREALAETALVALLAAGAGLGLAAALVGLATSYLPDAFLTSTLTPVVINWRAVAATSLLGLAAAAIAGITPAWMATRIDAADSLRTSARGGTEARSHRRLARGLLIAEVAFAAALLAGAGQLVRTFVNLTRADRGLNAEGVITGWVSLPDFAFKDRAGRLAFASQLEERLGHMPGVRQISMSDGVPPGTGTIYFGGVRSDRPGTPAFTDELNLYRVSPSFFDLLGIRLLAGRTFSIPADPYEVVAGERFAKMMWPDGPAIGHSFTFGGKVTFRVIGVAGEIRNPSLDPRLDLPEIYLPLVVDQDGRTEASAFARGQILFALRRGAGSPGLDAIQRAIRSISPDVVVNTLGPLEADYLKELARPRAAAALGAIFAAVALVASAVGLFGVLSAAVARRRREFGIRVALGIEPARLTRLVLVDAARLAGVGLAFGMAGAWMLGRALASLTYGVSSADPVSWAAVVGSLAATTILAAWRPGYQAAKIDPAELLRAE